MVTISVDKLSGWKFFASRVNWLLITYYILLNPLLFSLISLILFICQKLRKRRIKNQKVARIYKTAIQAVKNHWKRNQSESREINKLTINELLERDWEINLKNKEIKDVLKEVNQLIKKIDDELELAKNINNAKHS